MDREYSYLRRRERERERELCPTWDPLARINWGFRMNHSILRTHLCSPTFSSLPTAIIRRVRDSHTRVFLASQQLKVVLVTYFYYVLSLGLYASYSVPHSELITKQLQWEANTTLDTAEAPHIYFWGTSATDDTEEESLAGCDNVELPSNIGDETTKKS